MLFIGIEDDLSLLPIFGRTTVMSDQIHLVEWIGNTHRSRLGFHPGEGNNCGGGLSLTEGFHHLDAGLLVKVLVDRWVESLTSSGAVLKCREIIF